MGIRNKKTGEELAPLFYLYSKETERIAYIHMRYDELRNMVSYKE